MSDDTPLPNLDPKEIADSGPVLAVYAAPEYDCLSQDGRMWVDAIVAETVERCKKIAKLTGVIEIAEKFRALQKVVRMQSHEIEALRRELRTQRRLEQADEFNFYLRSVERHQPDFADKGEETFSVTFRRLDLIADSCPDHVIDYRFRQMAETMKAERRRQLKIVPGQPAPPAEPRFNPSPIEAFDDVAAEEVISNYYVEMTQSPKDERGWLHKSEEFRRRAIHNMRIALTKAVKAGKLRAYQ